jgi:integrase
MSEYDTVFARHERFDRSALAKARRPGIANLTRAVLRRLFAYAIDLKVCRMLYTGQRVGDAVRMRRSDIRKGAIHVIQGKTGEELYIELHPALERAMKAGPSNGVYLIGDRAGRPITRGGLSALVRAAIKVAGLPGERVAHGLRMAALRRLAEHRATTKQIQAVSGHHALPEIERYTRQADQQLLAKAAIGLLSDKD